MANEIKACPNCGGWIVMRGKGFKIETPKIVRLFRSIFRHGITCVECGYYQPTVRSWNKESEIYNGE